MWIPRKGKGGEKRTGPASSNRQTGGRAGARAAGPLQPCGFSEVFYGTFRCCIGLCGAESAQGLLKANGRASRRCGSNLRVFLSV